MNEVIVKKVTDQASAMCASTEGALKLAKATLRFVDGAKLGDLTSDKRVAAAIVLCATKADV